MPETRNRLASKQSDCCTVCTKPNGENWIQCESCQRWTHGGCAGYSNDEYKFLARAKNVMFFCDTCLPSAQCNLLKNNFSAEVTKEIADLKATVESVKSAVTALTPTAIEPQAKYSSIVKNNAEYSLELRFSGLPEISDAPKKPNRKEVFEHDEKQLFDVVHYLGVGKEDISGFRRLGKYNSQNPRARQTLVKFSNTYTVDKILARAPMLKVFEPTYNDEAYRVFVSKSLNKEEQMKERTLLKKRRELLDTNQHDPKNIHIKNGILYLNNQAVVIDE